ncbi:MAG: DinB family protein [Chloroflexota bacterium]|nr:DinB family protein [Chloroflexota bacterium]
MEEFDQIILELTNMPNWLSKRITPQRDMTRLNRPAERGEWSVRDIVAHLRDTEARYFPKMHLISIAQVPDLRRVEQIGPTEYDRDDSAFVVMSQFRRVRQSTLSLLRELPRDGWKRSGVDVDNVTVSIRDLALELVDHDAEHLAQIDAVLIARGALPHGVRPLVAVEVG